MCMLLKLDYGKFDVSNLFLSKVIKEKHWGVASTPHGIGRVKIFSSGYYFGFLTVKVKNPTRLFQKRHRLVHNGGFPKFEALYCSLDVLNSTEIS